MAVCSGDESRRQLSRLAGAEVEPDLLPVHPIGWGNDRDRAVNVDG
jgi:hypothetical protein